MTTRYGNSRIAQRARVTIGELELTRIPTDNSPDFVCPDEVQRLKSEADKELSKGRHYSAYEKARRGVKIFWGAYSRYLCGTPLSTN